LGAVFQVPHGLANALMISHVIRYNATDAPFKQATFSQYKYPNTKWRYARIADYLNLGGQNEEEKVSLLIEAIERLKRQVEIPESIKEVIKESETEFLAKADELSEQAFDDQCTGSNPRYPLITDLKQLLIDAYYGHLEIHASQDEPISEQQQLEV
jgi:acetaldehyde dehydrogenase/alcohol dehydrogenase